uniref:Uncharacterized protein n=1 Tax=Oryza glumipatula TaxID=40148 RepID=A0A0E0AHS7_9ORYZ
MAVNDDDMLHIDAIANGGGRTVDSGDALSHVGREIKAPGSHHWWRNGLYSRFVTPCSLGFPTGTTTFCSPLTYAPIYEPPFYFCNPSWRPTTSDQDHPQRRYRQHPRPPRSFYFLQIQCIEPNPECSRLPLHLLPFEPLTLRAMSNNYS